MLIAINFALAAGNLALAWFNWELSIDLTGGAKIFAMIAAGFCLFAALFCSSLGVINVIIS